MKSLWTICHTNDDVLQDFLFLETHALPLVPHLYVSYTNFNLKW